VFINCSLNNNHVVDSTGRKRLGDRCGRVLWKVLVHARSIIYAIIKYSFASITTVKTNILSAGFRGLVRFILEMFTRKVDIIITVITVISTVIIQFRFGGVDSSS